MNTDKIYAESIAKEYAPKKASKVLALKKLDKKAKRPANAFAYTFGVVMTLVFGTGMCFAMGVLGNGTQSSLLCGVIIGTIGILGLLVDYPIYKKLLKAGKKKFAFEIVQLANEISREAQ